MKFLFTCQLWDLLEHQSSYMNLHQQISMPSIRQDISKSLIGEIPFGASSMVVSLLAKSCEKFVATTNALLSGVTHTNLFQLILFLVTNFMLSSRRNDVLSR